MKSVPLAKTSVPKMAETTENWYEIDATDLVLGRLATRVANLLRGKHQPTFSPHVATRNHVIITNADKFAVTGNKREAKTYYTHSTRPGSLTERSLAEQLERRPLLPLQKAIERMLPDNKLRAVWMTHLHLYQGAEHPHQAQQPIKISLESRFAAQGQDDKHVPNGREGVGLDG